VGHWGCNKKKKKAATVSVVEAKKATYTPAHYVKPGALGAKEEQTTKKLVDGQNQFAFDLYERFAQKQGNLFFSPFSISTILSMTYVGAYGKTAAQMHEVLHFNVPPNWVHAAAAAVLQQIQSPEAPASPRENKTAEKKPPPENNNDQYDYELNMANKIFVQQGNSILASFKKTVARFYGSTAENIDFGAKEQAAGRINAWVSQKTQKTINQIVQAPMLSPQTRLLLINAIYFKGKWRYLFDKNATHTCKFHPHPKSTVQVDMMTQTAKFRYGTAPQLQILEMDYKGDDLSMVILLPGKKEGLEALEKKLSAARLNSWLSSLRKRKVEVYLPKFELAWGRPLKKDLNTLGLETPFSETAADFRHINGKHAASDEALYISNVIHKAFVEVDESGTEASGVTAVALLSAGPETAPKRPPVFYADHPFVFLIRHKQTGAILFVGRLVDPR
jgi:serpin B